MRGLECFPARSGLVGWLEYGNGDISPVENGSQVTFGQVQVSLTPNPIIIVKKYLLCCWESSLPSGSHLP